MKRPLAKPDVYGLMSAIWVMACNEEHPIMTYESIRYRMSLPSAEEVRGIVGSQGELFRQGASTARLNEWKQDLLAGKAVPSWLRRIEDKAERERRIMSLGFDDVSRSQFRTKDNEGRSPIEVIKWGLEHIERLRKSQMEVRDLRIKNVQMVALIVLGVLNILVTVATKALWP